ncbi:MAG: TIGR01212 family radical SAM protein [Lachnospiraceae bacterium]|nr:TIGR01212 family radical SAM protein [Lachnospiraceae bacterium]
MKTLPGYWYGKPYYSLDAYCKTTYHEKLYKIALDAGLTCPNRDGRIGSRGCIFCSAGGSGDFAVALSTAAATDISKQLQQGIQLFHEKKTGEHFIAYFQAYTNTYGPVSYLEQIYAQALNTPEVAGISIATRPDCLDAPVLSLLSKLQHQYPDKFIWVELGLQSIHEKTARYIRRGYPLPVFEDALSALHDLSIPVIVHLILGLPNENREMILQSVSYLNSLPVWGVKLQLLHVLKGTDLAVEYSKHTFDVFTIEEYIPLLAECICSLRPDIVIHRLTGDGPRDLLIAPLWSLQKRNVLNQFHKYMKETNSYQGKKIICQNHR